MKSLPIARRWSLSAFSISVLIVEVVADVSGAADGAVLADVGEFACVSATASYLGLGWKSLAFKMGVISSIEFWAQLLRNWVEVMTLIQFLLS